MIKSVAIHNVKRVTIHMERAAIQNKSVAIHNVKRVTIHVKRVTIHMKRAAIQNKVSLIHVIKDHVKRCGYSEFEKGSLFIP